MAAAGSTASRPGPDPMAMASEARAMAEDKGSISPYLRLRLRSYQEALRDRQSTKRCQATQDDAGGDSRPSPGREEAGVKKRS